MTPMSSQLFAVAVALIVTSQFESISQNSMSASAQTSESHEAPPSQFCVSALAPTLAVQSVFASLQSKTSMSTSASD
jgi:hypothetical protein